jgi:branched-chain amino acid aminotransferase
LIIMSAAGFHGSKYCWMNGSVIPTAEALVSPMESIHLGIFEGIKAYVENDVMGKGKLNIFAWKKHIDRLWRSAEVNGITIAYSKDDLLEAVKACIIRNDYDANTYIQPRVWPKESWSGGASHVVVPVWPFETLLGKSNPKFAEERRFMVSSWRRISSDALPPQAKSWANYLNSMHAIREAKRCGYDNAIFLDNRGFVSEGTLACLMMVRDGKVITPPVTASILESVTRGCFIEFIPDLGYPVEVRDVTRVELYASDEAFLCGTGGECTPITSIDNIKLGKEYPGPITREIAEYYAEILAGNVQKYKNWLTSV